MRRMDLFCTFAPMKKWLLQIGSLLMALMVLFVSMGWDVKFHYCTEDHHISGSFIDASAECLHCIGHHHNHEEAATDMSHNVVHYDAKCCCNVFDSKIQFTDNFVFSPDKHLIVGLQSFIQPHLDLSQLCDKVKVVFNNHSQRKTLKFLSGQERIVFFSSLKLNPLVF